jgi:pyruvate dehydrogenase E2 component (dihydrolipoamide acetyltransferase)
MLRSDQRGDNPNSGPAVITPVLMPQLGLEVSEATVLEILVAVGDEVAADAPLVEMETDKANTEVLASRAGFVVALDVEVGQVVPVGAHVAAIGDRADELADLEPGAASASAASVDAGSARADGAASVAGRLRAAPVARRAAQRLGVVLADVPGTGPRGRITLRDVESAAAASPETYDGLEPLTPLRRAIARRMTASQLIPQYQLERDVDATHLLRQKEAQAAIPGDGPAPGVNDLLMQAIAEMVVRNPALATVFADGPEPGLSRHEDVGVGLAVATDRGLVVPVLRAVHRRGLRELAGERQALVAAAREGRLTLDQMTGAAITLSNLASFGIDRFTAMLNPGESAIVAVGRVTERVVPRGRGLAVVPMLTLTSSFDHRTVDGAVGGAALADLAELLEGGMTWRP